MEISCASLVGNNSAHLEGFVQSDIPQNVAQCRHRLCDAYLRELSVQHLSQKPNA